ncbi:MAG TPA: corrinoid protein [Gaiellaceae bacterium]|nr:corrinoid protein [Gaiellaceae bacterium]
MDVLSELRGAVVSGQAKEAAAKAAEGLAAGVSAATLLQDGLIAAMTRVGELYEQGDFYVPEMLVAAHAMTEALAVLKPHLVDEGVPAVATVAIGTVKGDLHDIGKNLVSMMLEGAGFRVVDLGVDVPAERFVQAARDGADVVGMSALITTTMVEMEKNVAAIAAAGLRDRVRIVVGGAPVTQGYAQAIGADGSAPDASGAVRLVRTLLGVEPPEEGGEGAGRPQLAPPARR